jgi:hypothetical protein
MYKGAEEYIQEMFLFFFVAISCCSSRCFQLHPKTIPAVTYAWQLNSIS